MIKRLLPLVAVLFFVPFLTHADYACIAPYPLDTDYAKEELAFDDCQTDNYNMDQCSAISNTKGTYKWNEITRTCDITCNTGYYKVTDSRGQNPECDGSGVVGYQNLPTDTPAPVPAPVQAPVAPAPTATVQTTVVTNVQPVVVPVAPKKVSPVQVTTKPKVVAPVATSTPLVVKAPAAPMVAPKPNLWSKVVSFFRGLF